MLSLFVLSFVFMLFTEFGCEIDFGYSLRMDFFIYYYTFFLNFIFYEIFPVKYFVNKRFVLLYNLFSYFIQQNCNQLIEIRRLLMLNLHSFCLDLSKISF